VRGMAESKGWLASNAVYFILVAFLLGSLLIYLVKGGLIGPDDGYVAMGCDGKGKYLLLLPERPGLLEEVEVDGVEVAGNLWVPKEGLKVRYIWDSRKSYRIRVKLEGRTTNQRVTAPTMEPEVFFSAAARDPDSGYLLRLYSTGYDRLVVYPVTYLPEAVYVLDYPLVSTSSGDFDDYTNALVEYLSMAGVEVHYVSESILSNDSVLVIANGALPADGDALERIRRGMNCSVVYLGTPPDGVTIGPNGNVDTSEGFPGTFRSDSPVVAGWARMERSAYALDGHGSAPVERADGLPAVYRVGCMTVLTNTLGSGWSSPEDAAWDTLIAIISKGNFSLPVEEFSPGGDVLNSLVRIPGDTGRVMCLAYDGGRLAEVFTEDVGSTGESFNMSVSFFEPVLPGERNAVVKFNSPVNGTARLVATSLTTSESRETDLGEAVAGENAFRGKVGLPPGKTVLAVEVADRLSRGEYVTVPHITATARPVEGGYLVEVSRDGTPFEGGITVETPEKGKGVLDIEGELMIRDEEFTLYLDGYAVPVEWIPPSREKFPLGFVALVVLFVGAATLALSRRTGDRIATIVFRIPERDEGALVAATKIVNAFNQYNKHMGTEYLPLSQEEVKHALGMYVSKGVTPTAGVVTRLMDKMGHLRDDMKVEGHYGYHGPVVWERETGQSIEHLAMIRAVYDHALDLGYYAEPITKRDYSFQGLPDLVLTDRQKVVYVEVLSSRRRQDLEGDLLKHLKKLRHLREVDRERGFGYQTEIWVVLTEDDYSDYRNAVDSWEEAAFFQSLEKEGELKVISIGEVVSR